MTVRVLTGNQAVAHGALRAGVKVVTGYPGTPSTGALTHLLALDLPDRHVEWSTNEKVAFEIAAGAAWAGQRAMVTMKMSGVNVAADALISIAYSGVNGGLVIYVVDDPGVSAGMAEQDSRGYAMMTDLPMLEPASVAASYRLAPVAFELSEAVGTPVFLRSVASIANASAAIEIEDPVPPEAREPLLERDIEVYTKAGASIAQAQHRGVIERLERAAARIRELGLNPVERAEAVSDLGIVVAGAPTGYLDEAFAAAAAHGFDRNAVTVLRATTTVPFPEQEVSEVLSHCGTILVLEELEPHLERGILAAAQRSGFRGRIVGKLDGPLSRVGEIGVREILQGIAAAAGLSIPVETFVGHPADDLAAARPITVCAGCPHRGTFMAINRAIANLGLDRDAVMVTGDIGCTILGMNPPFDTVWNEVSMGTSVSLAQGYVHAGVTTPVVATIGDSTFFHGGIPGLLNAVQHGTPLTLIVMDNGWTSMTGMQVNPGTDEAFQPKGGHRIDLAKVIPSLGIDGFQVVDPFDLEATTGAIEAALRAPGVRVVLARRECAIQAKRRGEAAGRTRVDAETCVLCKRCLKVTGCPAISLGKASIVIDPGLCTGCGLCAAVCPTGAIEHEEAA